MKTHSARWYQNSPSTWILKETVKNGSAVLARITEEYINGYGWEAGSMVGWSSTRYAAQRAVRKALKNAM